METGDVDESVSGANEDGSDNASEENENTTASNESQKGAVHVVFNSTEDRNSVILAMRAYG